MKVIFYFFTAFLILSGCNRSDTSGHSNDQQEQVQNIATVRETGKPVELITPAELFTLYDAEKILGEQAGLIDSSTEIQKEQFIYKCAYKANSRDEKTGKTGNVYYLYREYSLIDSAKKHYSFIKAANENHGIKVLHNFGDEAYFHTDNENFYFIMVRKGARVFNMKVNKITSKTSLKEFKQMAKNVIESL